VPAEEPPGRRIERALLSVDDKAGLVEFARGLAELSIELWATSGTRAALESIRPRVRPVEELTGIAGWFQGRLKTLHPAVFGGVLAPRTPAGTAELAEHGLLPFDLVVVGFYPFERHLREHPGAEDAEEFVDVGGVALARAAAKNHRYVAAVTDPSEYAPVLEELRSSKAGLADSTRRDLARRAFERCSAYDRAIAAGLGGARPVSSPFPGELVLRPEALTLRYGENPHQRAASYTVGAPAGSGLEPVPLELLKGDSLSYTNLLDLDTALATAEEFSEAAAAIVKHATPCGVATAATGPEAVRSAIATDPVARYGCAIAVNRPVGPEEVAELKGVFVDLLAAPAYSRPALDALAHRPKIKLVQCPVRSASAPAWEVRSALGRILVEETDRRTLLASDLRRVAGPALPLEGTEPFAFPWRVVRHAKSNAIVLAQGRATVGIGSGQPTRVKAVEIACEVAGERARGAVLASDAFFPFPDGVEVAARAGVRAIVQPGGSVRDADVIAAAERGGVSMYFTGWRVFRH
jgi:phosphoribosylaminoimidazolecarboxamide formyltransferase / IMP cyclohydrolase